MFRRSGAEVTVVARGSRLIAHEDVSLAVQDILQEEGIGLRLKLRVHPLGADGREPGSACLLHGRRSSYAGIARVKQVGDNAPGNP